MDHDFRNPTVKCRSCTRSQHTANAGSTQQNRTSVVCTQAGALLDGPNLMVATTRSMSMWTDNDAFTETAKENNIVHYQLGDYTTFLHHFLFLGFVALAVQLLL